MATKPGPRVTRADVARRAHVSPATVSYVLNKVTNQTISEATKTAVESAAEELGYRPNLAARNLAAGGSGVVLYVIPTAAHGELSLVVGSRLSTALAQRGIVLSVQFETDDAQAMADTIANLRPVAVTSVHPLGETAAAVVASAGMSSFHAGRKGVQAIELLHEAVGEAQVAHLASREHTRLAFAFAESPAQRPLGELRLDGVRAACERHGLPVPISGTFATDGSNAATTVARWVNSGVTAVCAHNDLTALIVLHGVRELGLRCPDDLAVIGIDADPVGYVSDPPLTSVGFDADALVHLAVSGLLDALGYPPTEKPRGEHLTGLVEREST